MTFWSQIRERKLVQWALAYLAGAWLLMQLFDVLGDRYGWSAAAFTALLVALGVGFLAAIVLAWYHGERGQQRVSVMEISMLAGILIIAGAALTAVRGTPGGAPRGAAAADLQSIAVLPFLNMSADAEQDYFADGLTEELLNLLAQIPELRVAARTSSFAFKDSKLSATDIATQLNVGTVLEGSVRKSGARLRITAQLIDARTGYHLWSQNFEPTTSDIFAVQDTISRAIVDALKIELSAGSAAPVARQTNSAAHDLYLRGLYHVARRHTSDLRRAAELFSEAARLDPEYAAAHSGLAVVWALLPQYTTTVTAAEAAPKGKAAAERALALDPRNAEAHAALGQIAQELDWQWRDAEKHYLRALELQPNYATGHQWLGEVSWALDRPDAAIEHLQAALQIDPLSPVINMNLSLGYFFAGQFNDGVEQGKRAIQMDPTFSPPQDILTNAYISTGRYAEARALLAKLVTDEYRNREISLAVLDALEDPAKRAAAIAMLERAEADGTMTYTGLSAAYAMLKDRDNTIRTLGRMIDRREAGGAWYFIVDPLFEFVRGDARYPGVARRINIPA